MRVIPTGIGGDPEIIVFNGFDAEKAVFRVGQDGYTYKAAGRWRLFSRSLLDPWHELSVEKFIGAEYLGGSNYLSLGTGTVAKKY